METIEEDRVWGLDENAEWNQYTNMNAELPTIKKDDKEKEKADKKPQPKSKKELERSSFFFPKTKTDTKGGVVSTPQGYGVIQDIKSDGKVISVKVNNVIHDFKKSEVSYDIPLHVTFYSGNTKFEATAHFPIFMTITELLAKFEEMDIEGQGTTLKRIFHNGKELIASPLTVEKFGFVPGAKVLVILSAGKFMKVNRYASITSGWGYGTNSIDAITFSVNRDIRFVGFGLYVPTTENKPLPGVAKLVEGDQVKGTVLASKEISVLLNSPDVVDKIFKVIFDRPILLKSGRKYTCVSELSNNTSHYGSGGNTSVTGDGDVTFSFYHCVGSSNGTGTGSGQIPEFYYYA